MKKKWIIILSVILILLLAFTMLGPLMSNVEQPIYQVIRSERNIDIRQYAPMIIAEVEVQGKREEAVGSGFRMLADYIFGNNTVQQEIAMTATVQQQNSEKISMTAPVQQQSQNGAWKVSFVMPSKYLIDTLPKPNNQTVALKEVPAKTYAVILFSGLNSNENILLHEKKLMQYVEINQITTVGSPKYAFYNPPWTLPFLRRNEIMFEVKNIP
ncbi:MAG: heme-binding protein [Arenicellaceae bacterium]|nr:heme-binding protein [Arenicellaceae bacterium]